MSELEKRIIVAPEERERRAAGRYTGRYLLTTQPQTHQEVSTQLSIMGVEPATLSAQGVTPVHALPPGRHITLGELGVVLVDPKPEQRDELLKMASDSPAVTALEPERINSVMTNTPDYIQGWRDGVGAMADHLLVGAEGVLAQAAAIPPYTWGLDVTGARLSTFTGARIRLAILDTGFDLGHPDFANRNVTVKNFVGDNSPFHDGHGHGTHCSGTAAGPAKPSPLPRYGVAEGVELFVGRVLDDSGHGGDFNILQAIDWAIAQGCQVISMSLGAPWSPGDQSYSPAYEQAAQRALAAGCLIVAAAGNEASRPGYVGAIGTPGNSPSVLTVAAIDSAFATAAFSNRIRPAAPGVKGPDLAGPGVDIYSSWLMPPRYNTISGTSMATPHVAGIAALYAESSAALRGQALKDALIRQCKPLANGVSRRGEIGAGLVQAP